jgi:hypothetical protein
MEMEDAICYLTSTSPAESQAIEFIATIEGLGRALEDPAFDMQDR